jgi:ribonucleoside-diphosphate reductase alpha chain
VKMMAAVTPFISGSVSKTVNVPHDCTVEDIQDVYVQAWKLGVKCIAVYRDGSKRSQPLSTSKAKTNGHATKEAVLKEGLVAVSPEFVDLANKAFLEVKELWKRVEKLGQPVRRRLEDTRSAVTHKFNIAGHEGYITVGLFPDGTPGELFITMSKEGSTVGGLMDAIGTLTSMSLQYGVSLETLVNKFSHVRFEPSGFTTNPDIRSASSIIDYVFRWMGSQFSNITEVKPAHNGNGNGHVKVAITVKQDEKHMEVSLADSVNRAIAHFQQDAPACQDCGHVMVRSGTCHRCNNCGAQSGCS